MRVLYILVFTFLSTGLALGQTNQTTYQAADPIVDELADQDLIILKNGDEFIGTIIEYVYDSYVVLKTSTGTPFRFEASKIKQLKQGFLIERPRIHKPFKTNKFYYSGGLGTIISSEKNYGLHANMGVVRQFNQWLGIGLGVSYSDYAEYYQDSKQRVASYVSLRTYYRDEFVTPYSELNMGYGFVMDTFEEFETAYHNGYYMNPKFGLRFGTAGVMWTVHIGASIQHTESELSENQWGSWQEDRILKRTEFGFGLIF